MALTAITIACFLLGLKFSTVGLVYLVVIILVSLAGDPFSSAVCSIVAASCLTLFFASPLFSIRIHESLGAIVIIAFLTTSLFTSRFVSQVRATSNEALCSINRKLLDAAERESRRIARELDDDVGLRLSILAVELAQIQEELPVSASEVRDRTAVLQGRALELSTDVHALSQRLHSTKPESLGIAKAMRGFCREFGRQHDVKVNFSGEDLETQNVLPKISRCLFRVLQEALENATKHSGVQSFEVELFGTSEIIHLAVHDLGVGFDPKQAITSEGLGLTSMHERMKLVNGNFSIDSEPGGGTTIHAWAPLPNRHDEDHSQPQQSSVVGCSTGEVEGHPNENEQEVSDKFIWPNRSPDHLLMHTRSSSASRDQ